MRNLWRYAVCGLGVVLVGSGCLAAKRTKSMPLAPPAFPAADGIIIGYNESGSPMFGPDAGGQIDFSDRLLVWSGKLEVQTANITNAVAQAIALTTQQGGYLEARTDSTYAGTILTLRIPATAFTNVVGELEALGEVSLRQLSCEDVTENFVDVEARMKNKQKLRDRLHDLLSQATEMKDILAIETELNRVQGDIDSMEARLKALRGQVDYAKLSLTLMQKQTESKRIYGPLGYLFKGLFWTIEKLFVIRE